MMSPFFVVDYLFIKMIDNQFFIKEQKQSLTDRFVP